jgi:hypothetical protein
MRPIADSRIQKLPEGFKATCVCGAEVLFAVKSSALKMLERENCRNCARHYTEVRGEVAGLYRRQDGKWCSTCSGCGAEQAYTRKDHAKQSTLSDWQCKPCVQKAKGFTKNQAVGPKTRLYRKFKRGAKNRGLDFTLTEEEMFSVFTGKCALSGVDIVLDYGGNASLDRVDSALGYIPGNIQWVDGKVNLAKRNMSDEEFIEMCKMVVKSRT